MFTQSEAASLIAPCKSQEEIDRVWDALLDGGGTPSQCGWLKDRFEHLVAGHSRLHG